MNRSLRSRVPLALVLVAMCGATGGSWLAGCAGDRAAPAATRALAASTAVPSPPAANGAALGSAATTDDRPSVQVMADGSLELRPRMTDVSMLERQPDGSYRRRCGKPSDETRTTMEQAMRVRRGRK